MKFNTQNIHFISDFHVGHTNVIRFDGRPFTTVEEMHEVLINNWNSVVSDEDIVVYLGDLAMRCHPSTVKWFVNQLKGKIHFFMGNHDKFRDIRNLDRWEKIWGDDDVMGAGKIQIADSDVRGGFQHIELSHYPILSWNKHHHSAWHLHGHCHGSMMKNPGMSWFYDRKVLDMGCNMWNYTPVSYSDIKTIMNNKVISKIDHHEGD